MSRTQFEDRVLQMMRGEDPMPHPLDRLFEERERSVALMQSLRRYIEEIDCAMGEK
jgi:hypothetical protein